MSPPLERRIQQQHLPYRQTTLAFEGPEILGQHFGVANATRSIALGMMGMGPNVGYGHISSSQLHNLIFDSMASQGLIDSRSCSL